MVFFTSWWNEFFFKQKSFSQGINIKFKNEKDSKDFCDSFEEWRKDAVVQGVPLYQFTSRCYIMGALFLLFFWLLLEKDIEAHHRIVIWEFKFVLDSKEPICFCGYLCTHYHCPFQNICLIFVHNPLLSSHFSISRIILAKWNGFS